MGQDVRTDPDLLAIGHADVRPLPIIPRRVGNPVTEASLRRPALLDFARIWQAADKIVYSKSLETVSTPKTRLEREIDLQVVRDLKTQLPHDVSTGGPALAAHAIRAGLVVPSNVCVRLHLLDERCLANEMVYLRYHT